MSDLDALNLGLLILRVVIGLTLVAHGYNKFFGGGRIPGTAAWFDSMGFKPPRVMATIAGATELGAGLLLALGLATPLASAGIVGTLVVAMYTHRANGLWSADGGIELPLLYATAALGVGLVGAGVWSLDHVLDLPHAADTRVSAIVIAVGAALSVGVIVRTRLLVARTEGAARA